MAAGSTRGVSGGAQDQSRRPAEPAPDIVYVRSGRARHYRLTLRRDGTAVATIPVHGDRRAAERFVDHHRDWLGRVRLRLAGRPRAPDRWLVGTRVWWRGEPTDIRADAGGAPRLLVGAEVFRVASLAGDLRSALERQFTQRARIELPARAWQLAAETGVNLRRVVVRDQRTRWGSCSAGGTVSLNWRLVQVPPAVRDYVIYHELMHLREMNHSPRFWARVDEVCRGWRTSEAWLKENSGLLGR